MRITLAQMAASIAGMVGQMDDGRSCRAVLIETVMERRSTDQRVRTYCRDGAGWSVEASAPGHEDWTRTGAK